MVYRYIPQYCYNNLKEVLTLSVVEYYYQSKGLAVVVQRRYLYPSNEQVVAEEEEMFAHQLIVFH